MSNYIKIRPVGTELFHADRQTGMTKLIVAFRNFANAPKIIKVFNGWVLFEYTLRAFHLCPSNLPLN